MMIYRKKRTPRNLVKEISMGVPEKFVLNFVQVSDGALALFLSAHAVCRALNVMAPFRAGCSTLSHTMRLC